MLNFSNNIYLILLGTIILCGVIYFYLFKKPHLKTITPQCLVGALKNKNVIVVNVLSEKIPVHLGIADSDITSISKLEFENMIKEHNKIPENIDMVILFCAAWSCSAGENYFNELVSRKLDSSKIIDYAGGIHEWSCYSKINPDFFKVYSKNNGEITQIVGNELSDLVKNTGHSYKTNLLVNENNKLISNLCNDGSNVTNHM